MAEPTERIDQRHQHWETDSAQSCAFCAVNRERKFLRILHPRLPPSGMTGGQSPLSSGFAHVSSSFDFFVRPLWKKEGCVEVFGSVIEEEGGDGGSSASRFSSGGVDRWRRAS